MLRKIERIGENRILEKLYPFIMLILLCIFFSIATGGKFLRPGNLLTMLNQSLIIGTIATGATFIFGTGNVSLSMGGTAALSAVVGALVYQISGLIVLTMIVSVVTGIVLSLVTAVLSKIAEMAIISITLVFMMLFPAVQSWIIGVEAITIPYSVTSSIRNAHIPLIISLVYLMFSVLVFYFTPIGRKIRFLGDNKRCAILSGLNEYKILNAAMILGGIGCGLGAFLNIIRTGNISTTTLNSENMSVILSIVIGGMPMFGGYKSNPYAGMIGAVVLIILTTGLLMIGVSNNFIQAIRGILFLLLVVITWKRPKGIPIKGA